MMRSLFAGVSGLQNTQKRMDIIGNNIANISTLAFKSSRVTFADAISQSMSGGLAPQGNNGGVNPMQIGLGMKLASIDTDFGQGILETSNMVTDLALQGGGFFVASDGDNNVYTRSGALQVDENGNLLAQGGKYKIQGRLVDSSNEIVKGGALKDIVIPFGQKSTAKATTEINYFANLDATDSAEAQVWKADMSQIADTSGTFVNSTYGGAVDKDYRIEIADVSGTDADITVPAGSESTNVNEAVTVLNKAITNNENLNGKVEAYVTSNGDLGLRTKGKGGSDTFITTSTTNSLLADFGIADGSIYGTQDTDEINALTRTTADLDAGDEITISGSNKDGTTVSNTFVYGTDGTTVADLIDKINSSFSGSEAVLNDKGEIVLTDTAKGISKSTLSLGFDDTGTTPGATSNINMPSFIKTMEGQAPGVASSSVYVYDSLGNRHTVEVTFTKDLSVGNKWTWDVEIDGGEVTPAGGYQGVLLFNDDGSIREMSAADGQDLTFDPGTGAGNLIINLNPGASGSFTGLTQYGAPTSTIAYDQDGYTMGTLEDISFDETGVIYGKYTNGEIAKLAQIALAEFTNEQGLLKTGDNFYKESINSGSAAYGYAGTDTTTKVNSGYLEGSNVDLNKELTDMIITQRSYQAQSKVISTSDTLLNELITRVKR